MNALALASTFYSATATFPCRKPKNTFYCRASILNLYEVLSLKSENVCVDEIKRAYRSMARRCHPDISPPSRKEESTRLFVEIHRAYKTLSDPVLREMYDMERRAERLRVGREVWEAQLSELSRRSERRAREMAGIRRGS